MIVGVADSDLVARVRQGDAVAIARMLSRVERSADGVDGELAELHRLSKPAQVVGVTGAPGSGKSTLVSSLAHEFSARGRQLGVLAVDPSSPYSGGSILGDRVRMLDLADDDAVFVRSMATRGAMGGLSRATADAVTVLTASGKDLVVIETVGVGQDEVEIMKIAHTIVVVSVPGLGDDIQALKAGLLEIADVHVVNKSDREGAQRTAAELRGALRLTAAHDDPSWRVPVHMTSATSGEGVGELANLIEQHHEWLTDSGELEQRDRRATASRVRALVLDELLRRLEDPTASREFDELIREVSERRTHPRAAAAEIIRRHMEVAP